MNTATLTETPAPIDPRQQAIDHLTADLEEHRRAIQIVNRHKNYDAFIAATLKLEGRLEGLANPSAWCRFPRLHTPPESEAHHE